MTQVLQRDPTLVDAFAPAGLDALDIGCGEGGFTRALLRGGARRVVGMDVSQAQLAAARAASTARPAPDYVCGGGEALPFSDRGFDRVAFVNSLHHVPVALMDEALAEAVRVLRPGGTLMVAEPVAEGAQFELVRPVDDETKVRAEAVAAMARAEGTSLRRLRDFTFISESVHASFETLKARLVRIDPDRAGTIARLEADLRERFQALGRAVSGGFAFDQPVRVDLFVKQG